MAQAEQTINPSMIDPDMDSYPRKSGLDRQLVEEYADAIRGGATMPPVVLETGTTKLLTGLHRLEAHKQVLKQPELLNGHQAAAEILVEYLAVPEDWDRKLFRASLDSKHGKRLSPGDAESLVRELYETGKANGMKQEDVAKAVSRSTAWVSQKCSDIFARHREGRQHKVWRLHELGWSQTEIADRLEAARSTIQEDLPKISEVKKSAVTMLASGHPLNVVAERLNAPEILVLQASLEGKSDTAKAKAMSVNLQPYDVWQFQQADDRFGFKHPGRIPGQLVINFLHFFTEPDETVLDPMAGSGTTADACLVMGRKGRFYDIDLHHERLEIEQHDLSTGWPATVKKADAVFWDPPYFDKMDAGYVDGSISRLERGPYMDFMEQAFVTLYESARSGARFAFLMSDWNDESGQIPSIMVHHYMNMMESAGWNMLRHIQTPLSTQQLHAAHVDPFREQRRLARLNRYLLVAVK